MMADVAVLSADSMGGRRIGTGGSERARAFLVGKFRQLTLDSLAPGFVQPFDAPWTDGTTIRGQNIIGRVRGTRAPDDYVVVSAHYDHLGTTAEGVFHGADDNASGVAGLLAIAAWFVAHPPEASLLFVLFDGEEAIQAGSRSFLAHHFITVAAIKVNINLDMIGRSRSDVVNVVGTNRFPALRPFVSRIAAGSAIRLRLGHDTGSVESADNWIGQSDQASFAALGIPFLYFAVDLHQDYHRVTDTVERIQPAFLSQTIGVILDIVREVEHAVALRTPLASRPP